MTIQSKLAQALAIGVLSLGVAEGARAQQSGLVNVNLGDVAVDIAEDINVNVSQIPVTVEAPIGVAANVCGISANALTADLQDDDIASCDAATTSQALNQIVQQQLGNQE